MNSKKFSLRVEEALKKYVPDMKCLEHILVESVRYSLLSGGKRIRPVILLEFCELCGGNVDVAIPFACALEMVHTYSLIHDDLPSIDNDDVRRGKPSNHMVFGDDIALLGGDALLTLAFETILSDDNVKTVGAETTIKAARVLAKRAGMFGMIGGQVIDIESQDKSIDAETLKVMDRKKTGELICAAAEIGCLVAGADEEKINAAIKYAYSVGLAFQIVDDIIDVVSTSEMIGKPVGSDIKKNKSTYVSTLGIEKSRELVLKLTDDAVNSLNLFHGNVSYLKNIAIDLSKRKL